VSRKKAKEKKLKNWKEKVAKVKIKIKQEQAILVCCLAELLKLNAHVMKN
jgi:hypothetical protein